MRISMLVFLFIGDFFIQAGEPFKPYEISYIQGRLKAPTSYKAYIQSRVKKGFKDRIRREIYLSGTASGFSANSKSGKMILTGKSMGQLFNRLAIENKGNSVDFVLKSGEYILDQPLKPRQNQVLRGEGRVTLIPTLTLPAAIVLDGVDSVVISNFTIVGGGIGKCKTNGIMSVNDSTRVNISKVIIREVGACGILCKGSKSKYVLIEDCDIQNTGRAGIAMFDGVSNALITKNAVERTTTHGIIFANGGSFSEVSENIIKDTGLLPGGDFAHGVAFDSHGNLNTGEKNLIIKNKILNARTGGVEIADGQNHMYIIENYIEGSGRANQKREDQYGIYFGGALSQGYHCLIKGNTIKNSYWNGIRLAAPNVERPNKKSPLPKDKYGPTMHVDIIDNIISGSMRYGIELNWCRDVYIKGNRIETSKLADIGLIGNREKNIDMPCSKVLFKGNVLKSQTKLVKDLFEK
ncbi:hypothetical protein LNTAR_17023 [Lentisphaera araneosa HTCC2155]|uniref:Right handed beta helix domain-containing protein n=2 Tax=Lentisphaera TaxID=256846 RepID=A6DF93_9BACT|nr:hypothetical protein LNTAR_17023 [Lentisphaera araneosa HTCC2155]